MAPTQDFIDSDANYTGTSVWPIDGKTYDTYVEQDVFPILNITMSTSTWWMNSATSPVTPIAELIDYTPWGMQNGNDTGVWASIVWGPIAAEVFSFKGKATCPMSTQCGQSGARRVGQGWLPRTLSAQASGAQTAKALQAETPKRSSSSSSSSTSPTSAAAFPAQVPKTPLLPTDFSAGECSNLFQHQYTVRTPSGAQCCLHKHSCQVQYQYSCSRWIQDYTNQRIRIDGGSGSDAKLVRAPFTVRIRD